ncbi:hypothetical protein SLA2020_365600 [Shorea laevis]
MKPNITVTKKFGTRELRHALYLLAPLPRFALCVSSILVHFLKQLTSFISQAAHRKLTKDYKICKKKEKKTDQKEKKKRQIWVYLLHEGAVRRWWWWVVGDGGGEPVTRAVTVSRFPSQIRRADDRRRTVERKERTGGEERRRTVEREECTVGGGAHRTQRERERGGFAGG